MDVLKKILLISDNHSHYDETIVKLAAEADEVWHAGDIGKWSSIEPMAKHKAFRAVYGNIDTLETKQLYPEYQVFEIGKVRFLMIHIGGKPGKFVKKAKALIELHQPNIFICGHSHAYSVAPDYAHNMLCLNPGAYGHEGFHTFRTAMKFEVTETKLQHIEVIHLGYRGRDKEKD